MGSSAAELSRTTGVRHVTDRRIHRHSRQTRVAFDGNGRWKVDISEVKSGESPLNLRVQHTL